MTATQQSVDQSNLQEFIDSSTTSGQKGQSQFFTPESLVTHCHSVMRRHVPNYSYMATILDPQCGQGALTNCKHFDYGRSFGVELDSRIESPTHCFINGNCVKFAEILDDVFPGTIWGVINANGPFGHRLRLRGGGTVDSVEWTWAFAIKHATCGFFIAGDAQIKKLGIDRHPFVCEYEVDTTSFKVSVPIGIVYWKRPAAKDHLGYDRPPGHGMSVTPTHELIARWEKVKKILEEEAKSRSEFNIYLNANGLLKTYLSIRHREKLKLDMGEIQKLASINDSSPLSLTTERETRDLMKRFIDDGIYTIQPAAKAAIQSALAEMHRIAVPLMPVTDFACVAYADESESLTCSKNCEIEGITLTKGRKYPVTTGTYKFSEKFVRDQIGFNEETGETYKQKHDCAISGQDRYIQIRDDTNVRHRFMDRPNLEVKTDHSDALLWMMFEKPVVQTVREVMPEAVARNLAILKTCEMLSGFQYYPGQRDYLSVVGVKDYGLIGAEGGVGKSLMALSLIALKGPERCLLVAPQATMRSSSDDEDDEGWEQETNVSQWLDEIRKFAPYLQVFELFSMEDYERILKLNDGKLPAGAYVTYYQALFRNGARETGAASWNDEKFFKNCNAILDVKKPITLEEHPDDPDRGWCKSVGKDQEDTGIRCIMQPSMATLIGDQFDMVLLDEAHVGCNLGAALTQTLIRLQPKYRYALTGTPIPNIVSNMFSLMGWLCVPDWFKSERRNTAFPYARHEIGRFEDTFMTIERDFTAERMKRAADPEWSGKIEKASPVLAAPARLLKLTTPTLAYIDKAQCNPAYKPPQVVDVRTPLGLEQAKLYAHFLDRANIPSKSPLDRARKQSAYLRAITSDPQGFGHHTASSPRVFSNMNPKVMTTVRLIAEKLAEGEQVCVVSARVGLTDTLAGLMADAGIPFARIDSTIEAEQHSRQSSAFKTKRVPLMFMGMKCAASHSFGQCKYLIVVGIEWSPGYLLQSQWRIDRVVSVEGHTIYCILTENTIEEMQWERCAVKGDAATICLKGQRVPRNFHPVSGAEIMALAYDRFTMSGTVPESQCEDQWPKLREVLRKSYSTNC